MSMKKNILSICIASYNRKDIIIQDIKSYLTIDDTRFVITVQDDLSNDGTYEELLKIQDKRLIIRRNKTNLGALQNAKAALDNHEDSYFVLNLNDKDCLNPKMISTFLDYLEKDMPYYGYVDLRNNVPFSVTRIRQGKEALQKLSYLCKHPSGFFWRSDLFHEEINRNYYKNLPPRFDYQFDLLYAHFSVRYPGVIVYLPLIINSMMRPELSGAKSYSYTEENLYYGTNKRLETYELFLRDINDLEIDNTTKKQIQFCITKRTAGFVTNVLRLFLQHTDVCDHYNLKPRKVKFSEMNSNLNLVLRIYSKYAVYNNTWLELWTRKLFIRTRYTLSSLKMCIKEGLFGFRQKKLING